MENKTHSLNYSEKWMNRALSIAKKGWGSTIPNPCVGAVVVKDNIELGHACSDAKGGSHAEFKVIRDLLAKGLDLSEAELFVTLEPCSHFGKNPPCTHSIEKAKIKKVYIGSLDKNPKVSGVDYLKSIGVECLEQDLKGEVDFYYRGFFKFIKCDKPLVILKIATDNKGLMAQKSLSKENTVPQALCITGKESQAFVHDLRSWSHGVLVSTQTLISDNPGLDNRINPEIWGAQPQPLIVGQSFIKEKFASYKLMQKHQTRAFLNLEKIDFAEFWSQMLKSLAQLGFHQILVEAGPSLAKKLMECNGFDELIHLKNPVSLKIEQGFEGMYLDLDFLAQFLKNKGFNSIKAENLGPDSLEWYVKANL